MTGPALALAFIGLALALAGVRPKPAEPGAVAPEPARATRQQPSASRIASAALGLAVVLVVGGPVGVMAGAAVGFGAERAVRFLEPAEIRRRKKRRAAELPLLLDLLAVCLRAGTPLVIAMETVVDALPGPFSEDLATVASLQRLGCDATRAWADLDDDPDLGPVARAVSRSSESGARLAAAFERIAADRRSTLATTGEARARRAGVLAMAPLGLCFLPAFVSLGIVPIVLALAAEVLP